ncbi:MAG TPA: hypothetical protein PLE60_12745 [Candidatus Latescibacteria bacterium]|nr:MAG: hypothetical protein BWY06_01115 [Candidatus Latescibacteria bacterium ADurb.Bin168]HPU86187.1 hypothetical protein [Candidatus Latescibacterota bacterium]
MTWLERVGAFLAHRRVQNVAAEPVEIREALRAGGKTLVFLPQAPELLHPGVSICVTLAGWFGPLALCCVSRDDKLPDLSNSGYPAVLFPWAISRMGLPTRNVREKVKVLAPTIAVDLHPQFNLPTAYLAAESGASLRIGFGDAPSGYFNLRYACPSFDPANSALHYGRFLRTIENLRADTFEEPPT